MRKKKYFERYGITKNKIVVPRKSKINIRNIKREILKPITGGIVLSVISKLRKYKNRQRWNAILDRLPEDKHLVGAEIGVLNGNTAYRLLLARPLLRHIMIDPWKVPDSTDSWAAQKDQNASKPQSEHDAAYKITKNKVAFAGKRAVIWRMQSKEAITKVEDVSLDFVFVDGDHSYIGTKLDIKLWLPKIKKGGWIGGHDYNHEKRSDFNGIDKAVNETFAKESIETDDNHTWFVML